MQSVSGEYMNITTSIWFVAVLVGAIAVILICRSESKRRWKSLYRHRLVVEINAIDLRDIERVVVIDLGFGKETWLLMSKELTVDRETRFVQNAVVIRPEEAIPMELTSRIEEIGIRF